MIVSSALLKDLKGQLKLLQTDLRNRAEDTDNECGTRLREEYAKARRRQRTGHSWVVWRDNEVDQAAVAWLVATTFLRFCEDNDLLAGAHLDGRPMTVGWIAGPGERTKRAEENLTVYFRANPTHNRRHWLQQGFRVLAAQHAGKALVDPEHNPVWTALISSESAAGLIEFWRRTDEAGELIHDFFDPDLGTRFLGDLYQDLSEHAKKTYALLQTPVFVEEFILDQTLTPALKEFGHEGLKLIDPACGSGHFLLGAFERLVKKWEEEAPALDRKERVRRAMDSIHGVDLNPFAVAIARFRLTVAGLKAAGEKSLAGVPALGFHLAIGDSLLGEQGGVPAEFDFSGEDEDKERTYLYDTEDLADYVGILQPGQYHVVVGNPPYITVKDGELKKLYRRPYKTAYGLYALSVPFMELFFRLAIRGEQGRGAGYVGQITANSFMKREFGKKLIEDLFGGRYLDNPVDLISVIDTSGVFIPGHGTPTAILVGRRRRPTSDTVQAVLSVRGEPGQPEVPAKGLVWTEIVEHIDSFRYDGKFVTVTVLDRQLLAAHPWSLSGGGASAVMGAIGSSSVSTLSSLAFRVGYMAMSHADEQFTRPAAFVATGRVSADNYPPLVSGDSVRDFQVSSEDVTWFPYRQGAIVGESELKASIEGLWPYRTDLAGRVIVGRVTYRKGGRRWYAWHQVPRDEAAHRWSITYAEVATHNHFVLDRGGRVFKQTAPVIKLPEGVSGDKHHELVGVFNSSSACFWLKQVCHDKGIRGEGGGFTSDDWERFYQFGATKLENFPLPATLPLSRGRLLDSLAQELTASSPRNVIASWLAHGSGDLAHLLAAAESTSACLRERMIFEQEELDWEVYRLYDLLDDDLTYPATNHNQLLLGQRAFEIALARQMKAGEDTVWFSRHGSTPITDPPLDWPADYTALVQRRLDLIESDPFIRLLEKPEFKRRWSTTPWADQLRTALESAILDRLEQPELWRDEHGPTARSVTELVNLLRTDGVLRELVAALTGDWEPDLAAVLGPLVVGEAVPYLAAHRYKPSGLEKFRTWQEVWALQRREDAGEKVDIAVPPKYSSADFRKPTYWKARGKLDVPKERFILYPDLRRESDRTAVLGWAGWDHRGQALALARELPVQRSLGADDEALTPMAAGLVELEPWLHQWHHEEDPTFGASPAAVITELVDQYLFGMETTREQVSAWSPPVPTRGRRPKTS